MLPRRVKTLVLSRLKHFPAVLLCGPRQSGKTTFARSLRARYYDLEQAPEKLRLDLQWQNVVGGKRLAVFDEAQSWPELFPRLRGAIDATRKQNGRFLLLGSVSPDLMRHVSESLAGRLSVVEMTPFLAVEVKKPLDRLWLMGGFPDGGILNQRNFPIWQQDYLQLLSQRDLPNWGLPAKPAVTQRLLRMLAVWHGQLWNASRIGQSLGLSHPTVNTYMDYLEAAYLVRRLQPFHTNIGKRLVKSPRFYWRDTGLLHSVLNVRDLDTLLAQPWVGASWEGFVIEQILGAFTLKGKAPEAHFFRTTDQYEIDLVIEFPRERWAVECKLTTEVTLSDMQRLNQAADLLGADRRILISRTREPIVQKLQISCSLPWFLENLII